MNTSKRNAKKVWIVFITGLVIQILFDPLSSILNVTERVKGRIEFPSALSRWESEGIAHYSFDISGAVPMACFFSGNVEVKDDVVIRTGPRSDADENIYLYSPGFWTSNDSLFLLCNHEIYTVKGMFNELDTWLLDNPLFFTGTHFAVTQISFDPTYGFISRFQIGNCGGYGLLSPKVSECSSGFSIENFQVLDK